MILKSSVSLNISTNLTLSFVSTNKLKPKLVLMPLVKMKNSTSGTLDGVKPKKNYKNPEKEIPDSSSSEELKEKLLRPNYTKFCLV